MGRYLEGCNLDVVLADESSDSCEFGIVQHARVSDRARNVCQHFAAVFIHTHRTRSPAEADALEVAQQLVHGRRPRCSAAVDRAADADHRAGHVPAGQQFAFRFQSQSLAGLRRYAASK